MVQRAKAQLSKRVCTTGGAGPEGYEWLNSPMAPDCRLDLMTSPSPLAPNGRTLQRQLVQHLGHEFWRSCQRHPGAQRRRRARFRSATAAEGSISTSPARPRRDLIWEIGPAMKPPHDYAAVQRRQVFPTRRATAGPDDRAQAQPGAQREASACRPPSCSPRPIAAARGAPAGVDCVPPAAHSAHDNHWSRRAARLRHLEASRTEIKLCIGHP